MIISSIQIRPKSTRQGKWFEMFYPYCKKNWVKTKISLVSLSKKAALFYFLPFTLAPDWSEIQVDAISLLMETRVEKYKYIFWNKGADESTPPYWHLSAAVRSIITTMFLLLCFNMRNSFTFEHLRFIEEVWVINLLLYEQLSLFFFVFEGF